LSEILLLNSVTSQLLDIDEACHHMTAQPLNSRPALPAGLSS
jgi:hypothetical protein